MGTKRVITNTLLRLQNVERIIQALEALPFRNWFSKDSICEEGIANPIPWVAALPALEDATAVFIPITCPEELTSGPPEFPELIGASVCINPESDSVVVPEESWAVKDLFSAETIPDVTVNPPVNARALPNAITLSPT